MISGIPKRGKKIKARKINLSSLFAASQQPLIVQYVSQINQVTNINKLIAIN